jgi:hypothetical protein
LNHLKPQLSFCFAPPFLFLSSVIFVQSWLEVFSGQLLTLVLVVARRLNGRHCLKEYQVQSHSILELGFDSFWKLQVNVARVACPSGSYLLASGRSSPKLRVLSAFSSAVMTSP